METTYNGSQGVSDDFITLAHKLGLGALEVNEINWLIHNCGINKAAISDGYHSFSELYDHRNQLWITLCFMLTYSGTCRVWRSEYHSDGTAIAGWFLLGAEVLHAGQPTQITYHLPITLWEQTSFAFQVSRAPAFDGHTPSDVLDRLRTIYRNLPVPLPFSNKDCHD